MEDNTMQILSIRKLECLYQQWISEIQEQGQNQQ